MTDPERKQVLGFNGGRYTSSNRLPHLIGRVYPISVAHNQNFLISNRLYLNANKAHYCQRNLTFQPKNPFMRTTYTQSTKVTSYQLVIVALAIRVAAQYSPQIQRHMGDHIGETTKWSFFRERTRVVVHQFVKETYKEVIPIIIT